MPHEGPHCWRSPSPLGSLIRSRRRPQRRGLPHQQEDRGLSLPPWREQCCCTERPSEATGSPLASSAAVIWRLDLPHGPARRHLHDYQERQEELFGVLSGGASTRGREVLGIPYGRRFPRLGRPPSTTATHRPPRRACCSFRSQAPTTCTGFAPWASAFAAFFSSHCAANHRSHAFTLGCALTNRRSSIWASGRRRRASLHKE